MKILFILDLYKPHIGGVEILFENIISKLNEKGINIIILTSKFDKKLESYEKIGNIEIYRVGHNRYDFMFCSILKGLKLAKEVDLIHTTTYNSAIPSSIIGLLSGKRVVLTVHEIFGKLWTKFMGWKGFFFGLFERLIFCFPFDKYICVSNYTKNSLRLLFGIKDKKLVTIYNGIDYDFWNKDNFSKDTYKKIRLDLGLENNFVGLFYGRPGISKGLEFYIKAIPEIIKTIPEFKALLIVPSSNNNPITSIEQLIDKLDIRKNIVLIPGIANKELPNYILLSDFVIIPSLAEGFGFAVAEVCSLEKDLITCEVSAIPEVASGNINYIEPGNISQIVEKTIDFKNKKYKKISSKRFLWEDNIEKTLYIYNEVLGK